MKITGIELWHVAVPLPRPFYPSWIPGYPQTENRFTVVRVETASGLVGFSAGPALAQERSGLGSLLGPYLLGERADDLPSIRQRIREMGYLGIRAGWLEPAFWDILGKAKGLPVHALLGGRGGEVRLYASTGEVKTGTARAREVEARLAEGFDAVKLRVHAERLEDDLEQLETTRRAVGDTPVLAVDANQGWRVAVVGDAPTWTFDRALAFCRRAEELGFSWVEEPLAMDDYDGLARLTASMKSLKVAGGELNSSGLPEFRVMVERRCFHVYQPDAMFTGGIGETWRIMQQVKAAGAQYTPHTWTNGIGFAVNLQLHAASPWRDELRLEYPYDPPGWVPEARDALLIEPWVHQRGRLEVPTRPGLGFEIDERALRRFGRRFFRGTRARVAVSAVLDKGLRVAREAGAVRDDRLRRRHLALDAQLAGGKDPVAIALDA